MGKIVHFILFASIIVTSCATNQNRSQTTVISAATPVIDADEKRLWTRSEEEQDIMFRSGIVYDNKPLTAYINKVANRIYQVEKDQFFKIKVFIVKNAYRNAWAYPNGVIVVTTGFLARIDNEAQLAVLLGHEIAHITNRHAILEMRNSVDVSSSNAVAGFLLGSVLGGAADLLGSIGTRSAISGYSREKETEADLKGIENLRLADYDCFEAPKFFMHLQEEMIQDGIEEPVFYGTHPHIKDRIENYNNYTKKLTSVKPGERAVNAQQYLNATREATYENILIDLGIGRVKPALTIANRYITLWPNDARGYFVLAETYRQLDQKSDKANTISLYKKAVSKNPKMAEAYRGIGLISYSEGNLIEAKKAFIRYLSLSPKAEDRDYINSYISQCK